MSVTQRLSSVPAGILDSPTLARVERAILKHEQDVVLRKSGAHAQPAPYQQSLLSNCGRDGHLAIKRGLLWQQRGKMFSRWKERFFILTKDYLHCFRRASGADRISDMGQFLFKIKLSDVVRVDWENKKTYSTVALVLDRDSKIYLRTADGLEDWFELLEECTLISKERRKNQRYSTDSRRECSITPSSFDDWIAARQKIPSEQKQYTDSVSTNKKSTKEVWMLSEDECDNPMYNNRLSLLTDIDINSFDADTLGAMSVTSYRMSEDILCIQPPYLRNPGSFRSTRDSIREAKRQKEMPTPDVAQQQLIKFRERSYSDIQRVDRTLLRTRYKME